MVSTPPAAAHLLLSPDLILTTGASDVLGAAAANSQPQISNRAAAAGPISNNPMPNITDGTNTRTAAPYPYCWNINHTGTDREYDWTSPSTGATTAAGNSVTGTCWESYGAPAAVWAGICKAGPGCGWGLSHTTDPARPICIVEKYWMTEPTKNGSYITDNPFSSTHDPFYRTKGQGVPYSN